MKIAEREFGGLQVVLCGGSDGHGGGEGPLIVLLHGFGAPGKDLVPLSQYISAPPGTRFAFPAAPLTLDSGMSAGDFGLMDSRAWWLLDIERLQRLMLAAGGGFAALTEDVPNGLSAARQQLDTALLAMQKELQVPAGQIVLGGFSQGAMLSLDLALRTELQLGGLLLMSGSMICAKEWLPRLPARAGLPVLQSHGQKDMLLPFAIAQTLHEKLLAAKWQAEFVPFAGGHEIPPVVLKAASRFVQQALKPRSRVAE